MKILQEKKWVIMDKARTVIAKDVPRNRYIVPLSDKKDKKRILYYSSEGMARAGFTGCGFYDNYDYENRRDKYKLEAVPVLMTIEILDK